MKYLFLILCFGCAKSQSSSNQCEYHGTHELIWKNLITDQVAVYNCSDATGKYVVFMSTDSTGLGPYTDRNHTEWPIDYRHAGACNSEVTESDCELYERN